VCNNDKLEVSMIFAFVDDAEIIIAVIMNLPREQIEILLYETGSKGIDVFGVESIGRLIQCEDAAILTKRV